MSTLLVFAFGCSALSLFADSPVKAYGTKVSFARARPLRFPDFILEYVGERRVMSKLYPRGFLNRDFAVSGGSERVVVTWSAGTGDVGPALFTIAGKDFGLELVRSDSRSASAQTPQQANDIGAEKVNAVYPDIETLYIDLHRNPELAFHEQRTAATLAARVRALGYKVTTGVGGTGIVAILNNGPGPVVMLRTELDALPIEEKTGLPFASVARAKNDAGELVPVSHMCGHDIHMSAWAGTAELMAKNRGSWHGALMLVAQPAEEIVSGASAMIRDGLFTRFPKPDYALGVHVESSLPAGVFGFHPGYFRAAVSNLDVTVYGKGGHGARPQETVDPIVLAARIVLGLQTIVSRENNPSDPSVITVGSIHGGTVWNIIPDQVKLQLTVRSFDPEVHKRLLSAIAREAKGEAMAANAPTDPLIETRSGTDAVYNDPELTQRAVAAARSALGVQKVVEMSAQMGSEDFSQFGIAGVRSVLLHVGAVDPGKLEDARKAGVSVPGVHTSLWAPVRGPTIKATIRAETAILTDLLQGESAK